LNADISKQLQELEVGYKLSEKEQQITILKQNAEIDRQQQYLRFTLILSLFILVGGAGWLLWQIQRQKQKRATEEKHILALELNQQKLKEQMLHDSIERKNKQLLSEAMHLSERNELLTELLQMSEKLPSDRPDAALKVLLDVRKKIKANMNTDQQWEVFSAYFTSINQQFFDKLASTGISLTDKEKRLLALIKTGLSLKECASILHIEPASIKTSRYRLKQKLGLNDDMNLDDFVKNLPN
jgi:DNA-binding CsgD family transcriptional regulator